MPATLGDEVALVTCRVDSVTRVTHPHLLALASAEIEVAGIAFRLEGIQVVRGRGRGFATVQVKLPTYRAADGAWHPAVALPPELERPLGEAVLAAFAASE
ncbi:MAG TPA: hypothetical protein VL974_05445 [Magnetospirillum sp.]|nr:hypothetical protein [Magnetospirillum sp.]